MDFYKRKTKALDKIESCVAKNIPDEIIEYAVEREYGFAGKWVKESIQREKEIHQASKNLVRDTQEVLNDG